jgi:hypothetical protein
VSLTIPVENDRAHAPVAEARLDRASRGLQHDFERFHLDGQRLKRCGTIEPTAILVGDKDDFERGMQLERNSKSISNDLAVRESEGSSASRPGDDVRGAVEFFSAKKTIEPPEEPVIDASHNNRATPVTLRHDDIG